MNILSVEYTLNIRLMLVFSYLVVNGPLSNEVEVPLQEIQKMKRGIVEQCCENTCSLYELENYCN